MLLSRRQIPAFLFAIFALFIVLLVVAADTGAGQKYWGFLHDIPLGDKFGHFFLFGTLAYLADHWLRRDLPLPGGWTWPLGSTLVAVAATMEEFSQIFLPHRSFDPGDLLADFAGILVAGVLAKLRR